jgi:hypothetical protein
MTRTNEGRPPGGRDAPRYSSSLDGIDDALIAPNSAPLQVEILRDPRVISFPARPRRRHVPPPPRCFEVRIAAADSRVPYGRSRAFRLSFSDIKRLITHAERLERGP